MNLRRVAEAISRNVVLKRRLPKEFGRTTLFVSPSASLRYWWPSLARTNPLLLRFAREFVKPGSVVWDIGANVGLFSFAAASKAGPRGIVLSVEPDPFLADLLYRSARKVPAVTPLCLAVSNKLGVASLNFARRSRSANHLDGHGSTVTGGVRGTRQVVTVSLDWLSQHYSPPNILKMSVVCAEKLVL